MKKAEEYPPSQMDHRPARMAPEFYAVPHFQPPVCCKGHCLGNSVKMEVITYHCRELPSHEGSRYNRRRAHEFL